MAALISWVCRVDHTVEPSEDLGPTVTIHRGAWAYCPRGTSAEDCVWEASPPTPYEQMRNRRPSEATAQQQVIQAR